MYNSIVHCTLPYDNDDPIKDVVWVFDVAEDAKGHQLEDHLKDKHAGEDNIANLQNICQFVRLWDKQKRFKLLLNCKQVLTGVLQPPVNTATSSIMNLLKNVKPSLF